MRIGEYLSFLIEEMTKNPDISKQPLYSENGILYGWEDEEDAAKRLDTTVYMIRVWVNEGLIPGIRSNDNLIVPKNVQKPVTNELPNLLPEPEDFDDERYSGLISE